MNVRARHRNVALLFQVDPTSRRIAFVPLSRHSGSGANLTHLHNQHVTQRKHVKIIPDQSSVRPVSPVESDDSRSPSPAIRSSPSIVLQCARNSGQFSRADLQLIQDAFDTAASISTPREPVRPSVSASRGFNPKLHPYDGTTEALDTFLARFENFSSHFQWSESERLFNLRNCLAKSVGNVLWDSGSPSSSSELI